MTTTEADWDAPTVETVLVRCISVDRPHVPHVVTIDGANHHITRGLKHSEEIALPVSIAKVLLKNRHVELVA